ncbi:glycoside hydrolase family 130 protein [Flavobacterium sp.]|uniref:glycoside hydrolase family 130 protein n=1 Tax=Flavobacterium sp. TaxID=239 RepID=UPI0025D800B4|nr:glycoside hydrolase family 130 protein [Flavobacterium sp.]
MKDITKRFLENPLLSPSDICASVEGLQVTCLLNPGVFRFQEKIWLLVRVAERPEQKENFISFPVPTDTRMIKIIEIAKDDPELKVIDARVINYKGINYLTTLSHLRLLYSDDGIRFYESEDFPPLTGEGLLETFGIEDCRVALIENKYYLTYTAVSDNGVGVGLRTTTDWKKFQSYGMILPPHNKDCAIFEEKINGLFYALHRPSSVDIGGNYIWLASSPDGIHWGNHQCIIKTRKGFWDSARVGAGASPIKTKNGWLEIYHGANEEHQYCLGAFLMDLYDPSQIIARTKVPIMIPSATYELIGFFGNVVFTNGHLADNDGDLITIYYGASDEFICGAHFSIKEIFSLLEYNTSDIKTKSI